MSGQPHPGPPQAGGGPGDQPHPGPPPSHKGGDGTRDLWPRDFGRDGVSGLVSADRALRARDVSRPRPENDLAAEDVLADLLARAEGRPRTGPASRGGRSGRPGGQGGKPSAPPQPGA